MCYLMNYFESHVCVMFVGFCSCLYEFCICMLEIRMSVSVVVHAKYKIQQVCVIHECQKVTSLPVN